MKPLTLAELLAVLGIGLFALLVYLFECAVFGACEF